MRASVRDLRLRAGELLAAVERGESIEITYRGRPCARLTGTDTHDLKANPAFGMWADKSEKDVADDGTTAGAPRFVAEAIADAGGHGCHHLEPERRQPGRASTAVTERVCALVSELYGTGSGTAQ